MKLKKKQTEPPPYDWSKLQIVVGARTHGFVLGWMNWEGKRLGNFSLEIGPGLRGAIEELRNAGINVKVEPCGLESGQQPRKKMKLKKRRS